jgi:hypothetical protein
LEGPAVSGILRGYNAGSFPSVLAGAPANARIALVRLDRGPARYADDFAGFDMLLYINLTCEPLRSPMLGVGSDGSLEALQLDGTAFNRLLGGFGALTRFTLEPYWIYATLVPEEAQWFNIGYQPEGSTVSQSQQTLNAGQAMYLSHGVVDCPGPIPPPTHGTVIHSRARFNAEGRFEFDVSGTGNGTWRIERSSDLKTWQSIGTATLFDGQATFADPEPMTAEPRYYRALETQAF